MLSSFSYVKLLCKFFSFLVMTSFRKVRDGRDWPTCQEILDLGTNEAKVGIAKVLFGLDYDLNPEGAQISKVNEENKVEVGYFYVVAFNYGLRFPFSNFIIVVLNDYGIALSQLVPNS